ncbi:MAG: DsbA family protein [Candidatus Dojkabacteria bacterium]
MAKETPALIEEKSQTVTINVEKLFVPGAILLSGLLIASTLLFSLNNIATAVKGITITTTAATTTTPPAVAGTTAVTIDQVKALFSIPNVIKYGDSNAKVTFVEFSDPSCPYCHIAGGLDGPLNTSAGDQFKLVADGGTYLAPVPEFKKLVDEGKASYLWVYTNGHGNGEMGTRAIYCGNDQGKFWEVHDFFYSDAGYTLQNDTIKNDTSKTADLINAMKGKVNGVNLDTLKSCIDSKKFDSKLTEDQAKGVEFGVQGTPGFFVNTTNYAGAYSYNDMKATVDAALNS